MTTAPSPGPGTLRVRIDFHGPFRVGTGRAGSGANATLDPHDPLPAPSLKGLMRASARLLLPGVAWHSTLLDAVFGATRTPSPWSWSGADFTTAEGGDRPPVLVRARVPIDPATGTARSGQLLFAQEMWARQAEFTVARTGPLDPLGPAPDEETQLTVLACAAAGVHALGASRRRGLGWVTCVPLEPAVDDALLDRYEALRSRDAGH